jgi:hypothetical protein
VSSNRIPGRDGALMEASAPCDEEKSSSLERFARKGVVSRKPLRYVPERFSPLLCLSTADSLPPSSVSRPPSSRVARSPRRPPLLLKMSR